MIKYRVVNLVVGEIYETPNKDKWFEVAAQQQCVIPNLVEVKFHRDIYIIPAGKVGIEYTSSIGTKEKTWYRLTNDNAKNLVAYLKNKEDTGARNIKLYVAS